MQNVVFVGRKKSVKLPELGGGVIRAMPELKSFFFVLMSSLTSTVDAKSETINVIDRLKIPSVSQFEADWTFYRSNQVRGGKGLAQLAPPAFPSSSIPIQQQSGSCKMEISTSLPSVDQSVVELRMATMLQQTASSAAKSGGSISLS